MDNKLLLTSFQTWLPHQKSNSSDDLLAAVQKQNNLNLHFLRKLPVNTDLATLQVIQAIKQIKPDGIICCGMAESRSNLTLESNAGCDHHCLITKVNLKKLVTCLNNTQISHDAGKFVCEGLYYQILKYIQLSKSNIQCIFVHIPLLNSHNLSVIQKDFLSILNFMQCTEI